MKNIQYLELIKKVDPKKIPCHVAIIMDGNGRWAKQHHKPRIFGHQQGAKQIKTVMEVSAELSISHLTLYAFSEENWKRPKDEVTSLMKLLHRYLVSESKTFIERGIRFSTIGNISKLPKIITDLINRVSEETKDLKSLNLNLALSYSGRSSLVNCAKRLIQDVLESKIKVSDITESTISAYLETSFLPEPDLIIRTSGEMRISNFLIWESSYSEFVFTDKLWPDFTSEDYINAILEYQSRNRRFGGVDSQKSI